MSKKLTIQEAEEAIKFIYKENGFLGCFTIGSKFGSDTTGHIEFELPLKQELSESNFKDKISEFMVQSTKMTTYMFKGLISMLVGQFTFGNDTIEDVQGVLNEIKKDMLDGSMDKIEDKEGRFNLGLSPTQKNQLRQLHNAYYGDYYGKN